MNGVKVKIIEISGIIILCLTVLYLIIYLELFYLLKINGSSKIYVSYNEHYEDSGANLNILSLNLTDRIKTESNVKSGNVGTYKVKYTYKFLFIKLKKVRTVVIYDNENPTITLNGQDEITMCPNKIYEDEGFSAYDEYDGDLTDKVKVTEADNKITYEISDSSGNKTTKERLIIKEDKEAPLMTLKGSKNFYLINRAKYKEYGYEVSDNCDEDINVEISGDVDTDKDGTYTLTYTAKDSSGNETKLERNVIVYTDNRVGIVYLTFDDGPSGTGSTEKILNVLRDEGVKATFFVTGTGPDYLIKREYDEGHVVALHTNTHNYYDLYSSVDAYYRDLDAVRNRVYNITGEYSNIIRFPGGSNNTVSISASGYRIMNTLTSDVLDKGYIYFDWNVLSGDAGSCVTSDCVYSNVVNGLSKNRINVVLMHDIKMFTANALKDIIYYCKSNGYIFDTLSESTIPVRF